MKPCVGVYFFSGHSVYIYIYISIIIYDKIHKEKTEKDNILLSQRNPTST